VVWEGWSREASPYPDLWPLAEVDLVLCHARCWGDSVAKVEN